MAAYNYYPSVQAGYGIFGGVPGNIDPITAALATPATLGTPSTVKLPNPFGDLSALFPNLAGHNNAASALVASQLGGELSPQVLANLQNRDALNAVRSGMPGSNAIRGTLGANNALLGNIRSSEALQQQGFGNLGQLLNYGKAQTVDPSLQASIGQFNANAANNIAAMNAQFQNQFSLANQNAQNRTNEFNTSVVADRNATYAAAPNPEQAQGYAQKLFDQYLAKTQGGVPSIGGGGTASINPGGGYKGPQGGSQFSSGGVQDLWGAPQVYSGTKTGTSTGTGGFAAPGAFNNIFDSIPNFDSFVPDSVGFELPMAVSGTRDPYQQYMFEELPQSGTQNNWNAWDQSPMWA